MLRRDSELRFAGGMWVFPGGRIDPEDFPGATPPAHPGVRRAGSRGPVRCPAGGRRGGRHRRRPGHDPALVAVDPAAPSRLRQRRRLEHAGEGAPVHHRVLRGRGGGRHRRRHVDDGEIREHRWVSPATMLETHAAGEVTMAPPTFITLTHLALHRNPAEVLMAAPGGPEAVEHFATRVGVLPSDDGDDDGWRSTTATRPTRAARPTLPAHATASLMDRTVDLRTPRGPEAARGPLDEPCRRRPPGRRFEDDERRTRDAVDVPAEIICVDCGGTCGLLSRARARRHGRRVPFRTGDVVAYRCADCLDRWDIVLE